MSKREAFGDARNKGRAIRLMQPISEKLRREFAGGEKARGEQRGALQIGDHVSPVILLGENGASFLGGQRHIRNHSDEVQFLGGLGPGDENASAILDRKSVV